MNTDFRVSTSFRGNRKRKKLKMKLGAEGVLALMDLWAGIAISRPSGVLDGWDEYDIALEADWQGDPEEFLLVLRDVGFIDVNEDGVLEAHDWDEHQGWVVGADDRSERARKAAKARWAKRTGKASSMEEENDSNAKQCSEQCGEHADSNAPLLSSPTLSNSEDATASSCPELQKANSGPAIISIPLIPRDGEFDVYQEDVDQWQETFPGVDVLQILREIRQWNFDRPKQRKTRAGIRKHISTWLSREQDKGSRGHPRQPAPMGPRNIREAHAIQCGQIAKALNMEREHGEGRVNPGEEGGLLLEHQVP